MRKKTTKTEALDLSIELWSWMYNHKDDVRKFEWPRWKENGGDVESCSAYCPLCEYTNQNRVECCIVKWTDDEKYKHCTDLNSPYTKYCHATGNKKTEIKAVLDLLIRTRKELPSD